MYLKPVSSTNIHHTRIIIHLMKDWKMVLQKRKKEL